MNHYSDVNQPRGRYEHLATKSDLADLRVDFASLRTDFANQKAEQAAAESRLLRWVIGLMGTAVLAVIANVAINLLA